MPRIKRVRRNRRNMGFTIKHLDQFRHGHDYGFWEKGTYFGDVHVGGAGRGAFEEAWPIFRDEILHDWIRMDEPRASGHGGPGSRPYAWWELDAPERRMRIDGLPHPFDNPERKERCERIGIPPERQFLDCLYYGGLRHYIVPDDFKAVFESEAQYIERLNLWLPEERGLYADMLKREAEREERKLRLEDMGL
jgi:hypothetical protein